MDEKFVQEQEAKSFDEALANDTIDALQRKVDELVEFIAEQSCNCFESDCRKKAIKEMGYAKYLAWIIDTDNDDYLNEDDKSFIINKLKSA